MNDILSAIVAIDPSAQVSIRDGDLDQITWHNDAPVIPKADIVAMMAELQADYDSKQYQRDRKVEYDKLNQFEMQFDDQRDGTTTWVDAINGIKDKYPKGDS